MEKFADKKHTFCSGKYSQYSQGPVVRSFYSLTTLSLFQTCHLMLEFASNNIKPRGQPYPHHSQVPKSLLHPIYSSLSLRVPASPHTDCFLPPLILRTPFPVLLGFWGWTLNSSHESWAHRESLKQQVDEHFFIFPKFIFSWTLP